MSRSKSKALVIAQLVDKMTAPARKIQKTFRKLRETMRLRGVDQRWRKLTTSIKNMRKNVRSLGRASAVISTLATGFAYLFSRLAGSNDRIAKFARQIGWTTDQLQEMRYAAEILAGVNNQAFDTSMQRFTRRVGEAAAGAGEAHGALEFLGVDVLDAQGRIKNTSDLLLEVADAIQNVQDQAVRNQIGTKLFDMEGAPLINMLNAGRKEIEKTVQEARNLGFVIPPEALAQSEQFGDNMSRFRKLMSSFVVMLQAKALPTIVELTNKFAAMMSAASFQQDLKSFVNDTYNAIKNLVAGIRSVIEWFGGWKETLIGLGVVLSMGFIANFALSLVYLIGILKVLGKWALPLVIKGFKWLAVAAAVNPIVAIVTAIVLAVAGLAALIVKYWKPISAFFIGLWEGIKDTFSGALSWITSWAKKITDIVPDFLVNGFGGDVNVNQNGILAGGSLPVQETITQRRRRNGGSASASANRTEVGGELHIKIDSEGRPRVKQLQQQGGMSLRVDTGAVFAGT